MTFREDIIALDGFACRNPECLSVEENDWRARRSLSVHHIVYKSHLGGDTPENTITLCRLCDETVHGKGNREPSGRKFMLKVLNALESAADDRWGEAREELGKRYGRVA